MKTKNYTKEEIQSALDLHKGGASMRDIAKMLGCGTSTVFGWIKKASAPKSDATKVQKERINSLLLNMARGNDLSKWVGRSITSLQPREIYEFLKAINLEGELKVTQTVKI